MPVTFINKNSFILSDHYTANSTSKSLRSSPRKRNTVRDDFSKLKSDDSNLYKVQADSIEFQSLDETIEETPRKNSKRQRLRSSSESTSYTSSPEIKFVSPVKYELSQKNNTTIILRKTKMDRKLRPRPKKCNDQDIINILDSDDEEIFDGAKKDDDSEDDSSIQDEKNAKGNLRMKLRRSTEQSNYKVIDDGMHTRRDSLRRQITTPMRYRNDDNEVFTRQLAATAIKTNLFNADKDGNVHSPRKVKPKRRNEKKTDSDDTNVNKSRIQSGSNILKSIGTSPSKRITRRNARLASIDNVKCDGNECNDMNKENETDDSYHSDESGKIRTPSRKLKSEDKREVALQNKERITNNVDTPRTRRTPRKNKVNIENSPEYSSPGSMPAIIEEPVTPKRRIPLGKNLTPSIKIGSLTPSMRARKSTVEKPKTILETARAQLHVSAVPKSLPCREKEFNDVFMFLERKLSDRSGGCMYISGVPGTGKTATVNEAIRCLRKLVAKGTVHDFDLIEINGMKLSEPRQAYVQILKQLTGETASWEVARSAIEKKLTNRNERKSMTLLLIDELDVLCNKRQDVVYNLLDWPSQPSAKLVVITIANTMDLPERVLMSRVTSRLGLTRLTFQPYNYKQLQEIVITRLNESDAFKSDAIQLVARKVAAVSGDARRALDICRRATEIAEFDQSKIVSMQHVNEALTEMIANPKVRAIMHCSEMEKVFLQAVCAEIKRTGVEETVFNSVYKQMEALCSFEGVKTPNITESLDICARLSVYRLILCDDARKDIQARIYLNVSADDVHYALNSAKL